MRIPTMNGVELLPESALGAVVPSVGFASEHWHFTSPRPKIAIAKYLPL
jgi:hypothetical protein